MAHAPPGQPGAVTVLIHAAPGFFVNQRDPRAVHSLERHRRLAGLDLRHQRLVQRVERRGGQVDRFGAHDPVQLAELVADHRIDLGLGTEHLQRVLIADALLLFQFDGQQHQRRFEPLGRRFLQVHPVEETQYQAAVGQSRIRPRRGGPRPARWSSTPGRYRASLKFKYRFSDRLPLRTSVCCSSSFQTRT
jgi:hypothetical protein